MATKKNARKADELIELVYKKMDEWSKKKDFPEKLRNLKAKCDGKRAQRKKKGKVDPAEVRKVLTLLDGLEDQLYKEIKKLPQDI